MKKNDNANGKNYILLNTAIKAIEAEPELPGPMPDKMWNKIKSDRDATEKLFQLAISATKKGIMERLLSATK